MTDNDRTRRPNGIETDRPDHVAESDPPPFPKPPDAALFRQFVDILPQLVSYVDRNLVYRFVNKSYEAFFGVSGDEIIGRPLSEVIGPAVLNKARPYLEAVLDGEHVHYQEDYVYPDGKRRFIDGRLIPDLSARGEVRGFYGILNDITEMKKTEEHLREGKELFRRTFEQAPIGAAVVGLDFSFKRVNAELCRLTGYSEAELLELGFPDITHPDDLQPSLDMALRLISGEIRHFEQEKRYIRKDGSIVWVQLSARLIRDEQDVPVLSLPMMLDITERKRAEEALRESEERYRGLFDHAGDPIFLTDLSGRVLDANRQASLFTGYSRREIIELGVMGLEIGQTPEKLAHIRDRLEKDGAALIETALRHKDGRILPIELKVVIVHSGDAPYTLGIARDISGRRNSR